MCKMNECVKMHTQTRRNNTNKPNSTCEVYNIYILLYAKKVRKDDMKNKPPYKIDEINRQESNFNTVNSFPIEEDTKTRKQTIFERKEFDENARALHENGRMYVPYREREEWVGKRVI